MKDDERKLEARKCFHAKICSRLCKQTGQPGTNHVFETKIVRLSSQMCENAWRYFCVACGRFSQSENRTEVKKDLNITFEIFQPLLLCVI